MHKANTCSGAGVALVVFAALGLAGCGGGSGGATPEGTFKRFQAAAKAHDYGTMYDCMTVRTRNHIAGSMATVLGMRAQDPGQGAAAKALLEKYQVSLETPDSIAVMPAQLGATIKDQRAFVVEATRFLAGAGQKPPAPVEDAELISVQVSGDTATGATRKASGKTDKIAFRKLNGAWFIEMF